MKRKRSAIRRALALPLCLGMLLSSAGAVLSPEDARALVEQLYIDEVPQEILQRESVEEIFAGLDRYSEYFTPEEYAAFWDSMNDVSTVGLGIVSRFSEDKSCLEIITVYEGAPAQQAGISSGDRITAVDGRPVAEAGSLEEAGSWMRGEEGTRVTLTLSDGREITMTRALFTIPYTEYSLMDDHIGYVTCLSFGEETYGHFEDMLAELGDRADRWIVDLRDNSGGLTQAAADVAGIFTTQRVQALLRDRAGDFYAYISTGTASTLYPAIVLVNENSASSSELLAAALRDGTAGLIIGGRTFGKGVAQTVVDQSVEPEMFADGDAVRITSYRFYSPTGLTNDTIGVLPHLLIEEPYVADAARLLSWNGDGEGDVLTLKLGSWLWKVSLDQALTEEYRPAFTALLEALWPQTWMTLTTTDGTVLLTDAAEIARSYGLTDYTSRAFADAVESDYAYALNVLGTYGILLGDGSGNCDPHGELTRAELCSMLAQLLNVGWAGQSQFSDVPEGTWYFSCVNAMAALGFVEGDGTGAFHPEDVLTNEQMIVILARLAAWLDISFYEDAQTGPEEGILEGESLTTYSSWAREGTWLLGMSRIDLFGGCISYVWEDIAAIAPQEPAIRENTAQSLFQLLSMTGILVP